MFVKWSSFSTSLHTVSSKLTPCVEDFVSVIKANVTPCKGRELVVELLPGSHNWKEFYEQYSLNIAGLVPNPHVKDKSQMTVNHCWRFIKRSALWLF